HKQTNAQGKANDTKESYVTLAPFCGYSFPVAAAAIDFHITIPQIRVTSVSGTRWPSPLRGFGMRALPALWKTYPMPPRQPRSDPKPRGLTAKQVCSSI